MEDPWATGPSTWGSDKPSTSLPSSLPTLEEPPASFDVSDPWGSGPAAESSLPSLPVAPALPDVSPSNAQPETPGWSGSPENTWGGHHATSRLPSTEDVHDREPSEVSTPLATSPEPTSPIRMSTTPTSTIHSTWEPRPEAATSVSSPRRASTSSEGGWAGDERPYSPPSPLRAVGPSIKEESWGDENLEAALEAETQPPRLTFTPPPAFHSPKFEPFSPGSADGFGVFSSSVNVFPDDDGLDEGDEGEGWGRVRGPVIMPNEPVADKEEDWEEAQRRLREAEERVPREKVEKIKDAWKEVVLGLVVDRLEAFSEEQERQLERDVKTLADETYETVRALAVIPPDINTYPPVMSSLVTHERHVYALSRPNPSPSTSLLTASISRRPRRQTALDAESSWLSRSKLGEPDAPILEAAPAPEASSSKWSFWRKQVPDKQLVTSGGGILEVKTPVTPALSRTSSEVKTGSIMSKNSRPSSPMSSLPIAPSVEDLPHPAVGNMIDTSAPAPAAPTQITPVAPQGKSRFWGMLGRNKAPAKPAEVAAGDSKDLEISADEFSFLSEIPSLNGRDHHAVGDLLSMEPGRSEDIASLESMLSAKPAALPAPLAPPPRVAPVPRIPSTGGGRFVAKMKDAPPSDFDLLGGVDFHSPASTPPPPIAKSSPVNNSSAPSMWDDFLAPSTPSASSSSPAATAAIALPPVQPQKLSPIAPPPPFSSFTIQAPPSISTSPPPRLPSVSAIQAVPGLSSPLSELQASTAARLPASLAQSLSPASAPSRLQPPVQAAPNGHAPIDEFDDFATPQNASSAKFDDFDFSSFESPAPSRNATTAEASPANHLPAPRTSLDHTPTISLMSNASVNKGKRWPAPPSPVAPVLEPPPRAPSGGFPFLSPPPPPNRTASGRGKATDLLGDMSAPAAPNLQGGQATLASPTQAVQPVAASVAPPTSVARGNNGPTDWSFFDNL